jgi:hypothetical protein
MSTKRAPATNANGRGLLIRQEARGIHLSRDLPILALADSESAG